jgi:hypothetical protein
MSVLIARKIDDKEILVRFIFQGHLKNSRKAASSNNIDTQKIFSDSRNLGISLQREMYCTETQCKSFAKRNLNSYIGFVIFRKENFEQLVNDYETQRSGFLAELKSSPLDENHEIISEDIEVYLDTPINPSHADIEYINPAIDESDISTHTSVRIFSKNLFKQSSLIIDLNTQGEELTQCQINDIETAECLFKHVI